MEIVGVEPLIAVLSEQINDQNDIANCKALSYRQKIRIIDFITKSEAELQVQESSWRHCLLYLFLNGAITQKQFNKCFKENKGPTIPRYKLEKM